MEDFETKRWPPIPTRLGSADAMLMTPSWSSKPIRLTASLSTLTLIIQPSNSPSRKKLITRSRYSTFWCPVKTGQLKFPNLPQTHPHRAIFIILLAPLLPTQTRSYPHAQWPRIFCCFQGEGQVAWTCQIAQIISTQHNIFQTCPPYPWVQLVKIRVCFEVVQRRSLHEI